jgi:hypothetical protein
VPTAGVIDRRQYCPTSAATARYLTYDVFTLDISGNG